MKNITKHYGIVEILQRLPSSNNGNPRYLLRIDGTTCATAPDSVHGYSITNLDGRQCEATIGMYYGRATLNSIKRL